MAKPITIKIAGDATNFNKAIDGVTGKLGTLSTKFSKVGSGIAKGLAGVAAGVIGIGVASGKAAVDFEKSMGEVFTLLPGISAAAMDEMSAQVGKFSQDFGVLPEKVVPALYAALSAGVPADTVFDYMETATKLATGGVTDLDTAVDGLSSVVNAYGSEIIGAAEASDIMFTAVRFGKTTVDEIARSISDVTPIASALGVGFDEVGASIAVLTAAGVPTSKSTTMMKGAMAELAKENSIADKAFRELAGVGFTQFIAEGGNLTDGLLMMADGAEAAGGSVIDMFGSVEAGSAVLALTKNDGAAMVEVMAEMADSAGATDKAFATMSETTAFQMDKIKATVQVLLIQLGNKLIPIIQKIADFILRTLVPALKQFSGWVKDKIIPVLETLWKKYLKPLYEKVIVKLVDAFNKLTDSGKDMTPVIAALGAVAGLAAISLMLFLAPFVLIVAKVALVIAAVALLAAALVYAYENFEWFRDAVDGVVAWFMTDALPKLKEFGERLREVWDVAFIAIVDIITAGIAAAVWIWDKWGADILKVLSNTWDALGIILDGILLMITGVFELISAVLTGEWGDAWDAVVKILNGAWKVIFGIFKAWIGIVWLQTKVWLDLLTIAFEFAWEKIKQVVLAAWGVITRAITTGLEAIKIVWLAVWGNVSEFVAGVWDDITGFVSGGIDSIVGFVAELPGRISDAVSGGFDSIWESFKGVLNKVIGAWNSFSFPSMTIPSVTVLGKTIGGGTFGGWGVPQIPMLANGGVINSPTLAMVGEGGEREIVTPDRLLRQIVREESGGQGVTIEQNFYGFSTDEAHELAKQGTASALRELAMRRRK
jgi:TP901 family phage tail tape measure protein